MSAASLIGRDGKRAEEGAERKTQKGKTRQTSRDYVSKVDSESDLAMYLR